MNIEELRELLDEFEKDYRVFCCPLYNLIEDWNCVESDIDCSECSANKAGDIEFVIRGVFC